MSYIHPLLQTGAFHHLPNVCSHPLPNTRLNRDSIVELTYPQHEEMEVWPSQVCYEEGKPRCGLTVQVSTFSDVAKMYLTKTKG